MTQYPEMRSAIPSAIFRKERPITRQAVRKSLTLSTLAASILLSACAKHSERHFVVGSVPETYKTRHPIVLEEKEQTLDIPVSKNSYGLPVASQSAIKGFVARFKNSASGVITIMLPTQSANESAARKVAGKVHETIVYEGVQPHRVAMVTYFAGEHGSAAPIRLSYGAVRASVSGCGKWNRDLTETKENKNYHNFGCASQSNLAAIISNPADLLGPRGVTDIDATRRGNVIEEYRETSPELSPPAEQYDNG